MTRTAIPGLTERRWPPVPSDEAQAAVDHILCSGHWTEGYWTQGAEEALAELTGALYAVAFNSCTSALHAALAARGRDRGSRLGVPGLSFAGTVTGARHLGCNLVFTDTDPDSLVLTEEPGGVDATVAVDLHGVPHLLDRTMPDLVTDACQSLGTLVNGSHVGAAGTHAWSFSASKLAPAPDGGAVTTDDEATANVLRELRDYGLRAEPGTARANSTVVHAYGHNWRPSEISMALAAYALWSMPFWAERARENTAVLHDAIDETGLWRQRTPPGSDPAWHKVRVGPRGLDSYHAVVLEYALNALGVPTHWWGLTPLHRHPAFAPGGHGELPVAERVSAGSFCLGTEACPPWTWTGTETAAVATALRVTAG